MTLRNRKAATEALEAALEDVDNRVAAARALARISQRYDPEATTSRDAFRESAVKALRPYFDGAAKSVAWAITDATDTSVTSVTVNPEGEGWGDPVSLGPDRPADLPADLLPSPLREHVNSVASAKQAPTALPFTLSLAAVSATVAGKAEVGVRSGWPPESTNIYTAVVLGSAERKSPVEAEMLRPLRDWEREREAEVGPDRTEALDHRDVLEKKLAEQKRRVAKDNGSEEELQAIRGELRDLEVPSPPRLFTSDVTEEALGRLMAEQAGRAAILSSEGDVLRIFAGRYNSQSAPSIGLLKAAWSGDPYRVDRVGRDGVHLPRPLLTVGLTLQPTLLNTLSNRAVLDGEGVLARFLWVAPPSMIGRRKTGREVPGLDESARDAYRNLLRRLLEADPAGVDDDGEWRPHTLRLTDAAEDALYEWEAEVEQLLADGGELGPVQAWGGKLVGNTVRLAGLLHVAERAGQRVDPFGAPISGRAMERAARIARSLVPHALHTLAGQLELDPDLELARYVRRRIEEAGDCELTVRQLHRLTQGKPEIESVDDLREALRTLEAHNLVQVEKQPTGGRPTHRVTPHPDLRDFTDKSDRTTDADPERGDSVTSVTEKSKPGERAGAREEDDRAAF